MIPGKIIAFLERANVAYAGTRDAACVPHGHRVSGWRLGSGARTMIALIPEYSRAHLFESLAGNGQFSMTVEEYPSHEAYQFKGRYVRDRPADQEDVAVVDRGRERFLRAVLQLYGVEAEQPVRAFVPRPAVAVEFEVVEIYVQTPGPGAGARLVPAEA